MAPQPRSALAPPSSGRRVATSIVLAMTICAVGVATAATINDSHSDRGSSARLGTNKRAFVAVAPHQAERSTTTTVTTQPPGVLPPDPPPTPVAAVAGSLAPVYSVVPTTNRVIFLGIDDGIVQDPRVLAFFQQAHIPFSVFLVRPYAERGLTFWHAIQAAGGTIESHTITHPDLPKLSAAR